MLRRCTLVLAVLLLPSEAEAQLANRCFDAEMGVWTPIEGTHVGDSEPTGPPSETGDSIFYDFPPRVLLTDQAPPRGGLPGVYRLDIPPRALQVPKPFRSWTLRGDSLWIALGDGYTSVSAVLHGSDDRWVGSLRNRTDNEGTQLYWRAIVLREADCDSEPPVSASSEVPAPRSIPSNSGAPLALGTPVPNEYATEPVRSFLLIQGLELAGHWAGSDSVLIKVNPDGLISDIEVRYPEGFEAGPLEVELIDEFGPGRVGSPRLVWWNRTTRSTLLVGSRVRVILIDPRMRY